MKAKLTNDWINGERLEIDCIDFEKIEFEKQQEIILNFVKNIKDSPQAIGILSNIVQLCADTMEFDSNGCEIWECEVKEDEISCEAFLYRC